MLLTPDSTYSDALLLRPTPTPSELFQLGMEQLGLAGRHFWAAGRLGTLLTWKATVRRSRAAWAVGCERALDLQARLFEVWVVLRSIGLDVATLVSLWAAAAWMTFRQSSLGGRISAYGRRGLELSQPYAVRFNQWQLAAWRRLRREALQVAEAVRAELSLTLGLAPQALAWGGSVAIPRTGPRPLSRRQLAERRQRQWLLILIVSDVLLIAALLQIAGTADQLARPRQLELASLRPIRASVSRIGPQVRDLALPLPVQVEPTALATATWEPVLTATPIMTSFGVWDPVLPGAPGYIGPGACELQTQYAAIGTGTFIWPTTDHFLSGYDYSWRHPGLDFNATLGAPLYAADSGQVVYAGWNNYGYGNFVVLDHGDGWFTAYAHLSQFYVKCLDSVSQGQIIGAAGSTGNSTGPHLHFEVFQTGVGQINPWTILP